MRNKILILSLVVVLSISFFLPIKTNAQTIAEFEAEVTKYTKELQEKQAKVASNDKEVAQIKEKIKSIEKEIEQKEDEINELQEEIEKNEKEIERKTEESKKIIEYYQLSNGDNAYLEYVFGADSITDMIYRASVVEQLTEYNDNLMKELEDLIKQNEEKKVKLEQDKKDLATLEENLKKEQDKINADTASIKETMPKVEEQIKAAKANVTYYKNLGCGTTEDIQACQYRIEQARLAAARASQTSSGSVAIGSVPSTNGFYRPMEYGYVTQWYKGTSHMGVDLSSSNKTIAIYPIANGVVFARFYDSYGALVVKIRHNYNGRYIYSTYAHLSKWTVSVGQSVTQNTQIGNMGSTGYSTGPHLHLEITTCDWNTGGGCTWYQYQRSTINPTSLIALPSSWTNR